MRNLYFVKVVELEQMQQEKEKAEQEVKRLNEMMVTQHLLVSDLSEQKFDLALREAEISLHSKLDATLALW